MSDATPNTSRTGYLLALGSAVTAGLLPVLSKLLLSTTKPVTAAAVTFLVAGLILLPIKPGQRPGKKSAPWMLATGMLGAALAPSLYLYGVDQTSAVNAALLVNAEVFFTGLIAYVVFKERLKRAQLLESVLVVLGIVVVTTGLSPTTVQLFSGLGGNILILASGVVWAVDNNLSRLTSQRFGPIFVSKFRNIFGGGLLLAFLFAASSVSVTLGAVPFLAAFAIDITLSTITFMGALIRIGAVRTLIVFSTTSIFGSLFAIVGLGEGISLVQAGGGALILLGVFLIQRSEGAGPAA